MNVTREELAAFADGELDPERCAEIEHAVASDPALAREVAAHRALRVRLSAHYAPVLDEPVPGQLQAMLQPKSNVVPLASRQRAGADPRRLLRWGWISGPAIAACLVLSLFIARGSAPDGYATQRIASALDNQLVATQSADAPVRVLISFRDRSGSYCRAFASADQSGIACKDARGWQLKQRLGGSAAPSGEYRQAGNANDELLEQAQDMADGLALDAAQEELAMAGNWKPAR